MQTNFNTFYESKKNIRGDIIHKKILYVSYLVLFQVPIPINIFAKKNTEKF